MTEIMPVPRNLILLSYQQRAFPRFFFFGAAGQTMHKPVRALIEWTITEEGKC